MEVESPDLLVFGKSKHPLKYGFDLEVGKGRVVPEIKYFPQRKGEADAASLLKEYEEITTDIMKRAVDIGLSDIQLETEQTLLITKNPRLGGDITAMQKAILERYANEHGIKCALRVTVADIRSPEGDMRHGKEISLILEAFEHAADNGADVLSIESEGGKEVFNHAVIREDVKGVVFSVGVLGSLDMEFLWEQISRIANKRGVVPGGDTDCAHANTAMMLAGGLSQGMLSHVFAALIRALGAARSLVAYEQGAVGPGKDCGYENVILKGITGMPMSMEGKSSAPAHSSLLGNVAAAACDLWSNEQVENLKMYGGSAPQVFTEILGYDAALMNAALKEGFGPQLRDLFSKSGPMDPQTLILFPENAWEIGRAIVREGGNYYLRAKEAFKKALEIIENASKQPLKLSSKEAAALKNLKKELTQLPEESVPFIEECLSEYKKTITNFKPENYGL